ncbi:hypothetical protein HYPSUDRAFT_39992 [Hypholoma sublateritium FD-334 SS-4]|uniref:Uncharacterized protein n=1 Tax=Hypholoma sublateritium (strain FD-334 SS-4) TaxID=945553 RepID=A0A0D2PUE2_HYPSF|nr:hypothetical protein HYPSUDRAFT_39992 [Hypholoma sublateritium FD-334 SS-4]
MTEKKHLALILSSKLLPAVGSLHFEGPYRCEYVFHDVTKPATVNTAEPLFDVLVNNIDNFNLLDVDQNVPCALVDRHSAMVMGSRGRQGSFFTEGNWFP